MRSTLLLALVLALPSSQAQHQHDDEHPIRMPGTPERTIPPTSPLMTGAQLLHLLDPPTGTRDRQASVDAGLRYLMGVHDATESKEWCYTGQRPAAKPAVMQMRMLEGLRKLPPDQLKRNAANLVVRIWQWDWPCPPEGCCRG